MRLAVVTPIECDVTVALESPPSPPFALLSFLWSRKRVVPPPPSTLEKSHTERETTNHTSSSRNGRTSGGSVMMCLSIPYCIRRNRLLAKNSLLVHNKCLLMHTGLCRCVNVLGKLRLRRIGLNVACADYANITKITAAVGGGYLILVGAFRYPDSKKWRQLWRHHSFIPSVPSVEHSFNTTYLPHCENSYYKQHILFKPWIWAISLIPPIWCSGVGMSPKISGKRENFRRILRAQQALLRLQHQIQQPPKKRY